MNNRRGRLRRAAGETRTRLTQQPRRDLVEDSRPLPLAVLLAEPLPALLAHADSAHGRVVGIRSRHADQRKSVYGHVPTAPTPGHTTVSIHRRRPCGLRVHTQARTVSIHEQMCGNRGTATMNQHNHAPIDDLTTWIDAYRTACANRDQWSEIADRAKQQITQHLDRAAADTGTINGRPAVRWSHVTSSRIDTKTLKANNPELAERYTVTTSSRRFTLIDPDTAA